MVFIENQFCSYKTIMIKNNQTDVTYRELFCDYFAGAIEITIYEPYIRKDYQLNNLKELVLLLKETQGISKINLITNPSDGRRNDCTYEQQDKGLEALQKLFIQKGITFDYKYVPNMKVRRITCGNGRAIHTDRGLHFYQPPPKNAQATVEQSERLCMRTEIEYIEPVDVSSIIDLLQGVSFKPQENTENDASGNKDNNVVKESRATDHRQRTAIIIDNITNSDVSNYKLRIKNDNKFLFPNEVRGKPYIYLFTFSYKDVQYDAKYTIGSSDYRLRSGILKLGRELYNAIGIEAGTNLQIELEKDGIYHIKKL